MSVCKRVEGQIRKFKSQGGVGRSKTSGGRNLFCYSLGKTSLGRRSATSAPTALHFAATLGLRNLVEAMVMLESLLVVALVRLLHFWPFVIGNKVCAF